MLVTRIVFWVFVLAALILVALLGAFLFLSTLAVAEFILEANAL